MELTAATTNPRPSRAHRTYQPTTTTRVPEVGDADYVAEVMPLSAMPIGDLVRYLRTIGIDRGTFEPAATVTLTGEQIIAIAERLAR